MTIDPPPGNPSARVRRTSAVSNPAPVVDKRASPTEKAPVEISPGRRDPQNPIHSLQSLRRALRIEPDAPLPARVILTGQPTEKQRLLLLQSARQQPGMARELTALLQSPRLQLVQLDIGGHNLLTYTDRALAPGQLVRIQIGSAAPLLWLDRGASMPETLAAERKLIDENLRTALPRQAPLTPLLRAIDKLLDQRDAGAAAARALLPEPLRGALAALRSFAYTPRQLSNPAGLAQALQRSGVQFEHRLMQAGADLSRGGKTGAAPVRDDLKGTLLQLLSQLSHSAAQRAGGAVPLPETPGSPHPAVPAAFQNGGEGHPLLLFLRRLANPAGAGNPNSARHQLIELLHLQILAGIAKLQVQQMHALSSRKPSRPDTQGEPSQPCQSWHIELPVRYGTDIHRVEIHIDEDWLEEKNTGHETERTRQWEVMLSFEIPGGGAFHARLKIVEDSVAASFWAERESTLEQARQKLRELREKLESSGVRVKDIQCLPGQPPSRETRLDYSLVDITT